MELNLLEKFVLLAHNPRKNGLLISDIQLKNGLIGAILMDLSMNGVLMVVRDRLFIHDTNKIHHLLASEVASDITKDPKEHTLDYWIRHLAGKADKYKWLVMDQLAEKELIKIEEKKFLGVFTYRTTRLLNASARTELVKSAKRQLFNPDKNVINEDTIMTGLIAASNLHVALAKNERESRNIQFRLKKELQYSPIGGSVYKSIRRLRSAIRVSVVTAPSTNVPVGN